METWFIILSSLCIVALIKALVNLLHPTRTPNHRLPPTLSTFYLFCKFLWHRSSFHVESIIRSHGPIVAIDFNFNPYIFISDRSLAHQALIQNPAVFADRPPATALGRITSRNQHTINSAAYGPLWRLLRRNLMAGILRPSCVKSYSHARKWVLQVLQDCFNSHSKSGDPVQVIEHFQHAMFSLSVLMCFGDKLDKKRIKEVMDVQRLLLVNLPRFGILDIRPRVTKILFRKRWKEFFAIREQQEAVLMPLIREIRKLKEERMQKTEENDDDGYVLSYADTLFDLQLPEENNRKLDDMEIRSLCTEFINSGETTSIVLQWIMASLVKYPHIQEKLYTEIKQTLGDAEKEVKEDDLQKVPYLRAVILESLRRYPPGNLVLPHAVTKEIVLNGFLFPKNALINFMAAEIGRDSKVWDDPMAFKPERFLNGEDNRGMFDIIRGSREIRMMPFGVGRRICPGLGLAMLHLEYFVANFIWCYEWKAVDGDEVILEEIREFSTALKHPLQAYVIPRLN